MRRKGLGPLGTGLLIMRLAAWQARRVRDDLAGALSELSKIDGCDLAAFPKERRYRALVARIGPPLIPACFLLFRPACHGNTNTFPRALLPNTPGSRLVPELKRPFAVPNHIVSSLLGSAHAQARAK